MMPFVVTLTGYQLYEIIGTFFTPLVISLTIYCLICHLSESMSISDSRLLRHIPFVAQPTTSGAAEAGIEQADDARARNSTDEICVRKFISICVFFECSTID